MPSFRYLFVYRAIQSSRLYFVTVLLKFILRHYQFKFGYQIPPAAKIGRGVYLGHFGTIIINGKAVIVENCNIVAGVVIGAASQGYRKGPPKKICIFRGVVSETGYILKIILIVFVKYQLIF